MPKLKVVNGKLDVIPIEEKENFALYGQIDPMSLADIRDDDYQREILSEKKIKDLQTAMLRGERISPVDLGMRGDSYEERPRGTFYLDSPVYVIDGLQRITAAKRLVERGEIYPALHALIHFETTPEWELRRFTKINTGQTSLSGNILLRNLAKSNEGARVMLKITSDTKFVLDGKVSWNQNMRRTDLIRATTYYKAVGRLMSFAGPGKSSPIDMATGGIDKMIAKVGRNVFIHNVRAFFLLVDEVYGVKTVAYRQEASQLKASFLSALAGVLSDHENFWEGNRLEVPAPLKRRLAAFPIMDPYVRSLAAGTSGVIPLLEQKIIDHLNERSPKKSPRLKRRLTAEDLVETDETAGDEDE